jgi:prolyl-tRNA synthetase
VQDKIERLIDKHMQSVGAAKVSLSSISSQELWERSGRLQGRDSELFQLEDRKGAKFLLSPTHEEEITTIVKNAVHSYKDLPLRLYQVTRKYRDEARPRQGLLRGREFVMKDLYTFDVTEKKAMETYAEVSEAYRNFLDEVALPYLVAKADSGSIGGNHSHEYHFASTKGEDTIISCKSCHHTINEELWRPKHDDTKGPTSSAFQKWIGRTLKSTATGAEQNESGQRTESSAPRTPSDRTAALVEVYIPEGSSVNTDAIKDLIPDLDTSGSFNLEQTLSTHYPNTTAVPKPWQRISIRDPRISADSVTCQAGEQCPPTLTTVSPFLLTKPETDSPCPSCGAQALSFTPTVEIGHTFHLGTRYSKPLAAQVQTEQNEVQDIQMGCHGIGVSRLLGTIASLLADEKGLNWPVKIAPFGAVVVGTGAVIKEDVEGVHDDLAGFDPVIDDRERPFGWKLKDADLIGYPFIVIVGKAWKERQSVELQCRRLGIKEVVGCENLRSRIDELVSAL